VRTGLGDLVAIMDRLREPGGCPWDREQSFATLRGYLIEECYEVAEALDRSDPDALREELGDLLLQVVFLSRIAKENGSFTIEDVIRGIVDKMVRRHPHVFGSEKAETSEEVLRNWEEIKKKEKETAAGGSPAPARSLLDGIPAALPAVQRARLLGERASRVGFDWTRPEEVLAKLDEELDELRRAVTTGETDEAGRELGDLLFASVMLGRKLGVDAEAALQGANRRFRERFAWMERTLAADGSSMAEAGSETLETLWRRAKDELGRVDRTGD
jgi:MazG family protein